MDEPTHDTLSKDSLVTDQVAANAASTTGAAMRKESPDRVVAADQTPADAHLLSAIEGVRDSIRGFNTHMRELDARGSRIARRTSLVIHGVLVLLLLQALFIGYQISGMSGIMEVMLKNMETMYSFFGQVTHQVEGLTKDVSGMNTDISGMPEISERMVRINHSVAAMTDNIELVAGNLQYMNDSVSSINLGVNNMSRRFGHLTFNVGRMNRDVYQMSRPSGMMTPMGNFPFP
ncbi:MAG: hypothetical protein HQL64_15390 [Magnetococcales bacterium]|nr:hypothetical protein [Magnetococcales bacterium]